MGHDIGNIHIIEFKDVVNHFFLLGGNQTVFCSGIYNGENFFFGHSFCNRIFSADGGN